MIKNPKNTKGGIRKKIPPTSAQILCYYYSGFVYPEGRDKYIKKKVTTQYPQCVDTEYSNIFGAIN